MLLFCRDFANIFEEGSAVCCLQLGPIIFSSTSQCTIRYTARVLAYPDFDWVHMAVDG